MLLHTAPGVDGHALGPGPGRRTRPGPAHRPACSWRKERRLLSFLRLSSENRRALRSVGSRDMAGRVSGVEDNGVLQN